MALPEDGDYNTRNFFEVRTRAGEVMRKTMDKVWCQAWAWANIFLEEEYMNKKRFGLAALMGLCTAMTVFAGGSQAGKEANVAIPDKLPALSPDHPIELSMIVFSYAEQPDFQNNKILRLFREELGVTLNLEIIASNHEEKIGVMIADGTNYPDIMNVVDVNARFVDAGALYPLDDYLKPNLAANIMEFVGPYKKRMSHISDGKFYILPNAGRYFSEPIANTHMGPAFWIQKDVLAEAGYPSPRTLEEYFKLLEDYKTRHPTIDGQPTIAFSMDAGAPDKYFTLVNPPEHLIGHPNDGNVVVTNGKAEVFAGKDYAKRYYQFLNDMWNRGLIDRESFTQNHDQYLAKIGTGRVLGIFDQGWSFSAGTSPLVQREQHHRTYVPMMITYEGYEPYYRDRAVMNVEMGFCVSSTTTKRNEAIAFLNTILEEKWQKILFWGVEGEDYMVDANGRMYLTDAQYNQRQDPVWRAKNSLMVLQDQGPKHQDMFSDGNAFMPTAQPEVIQAYMPAYDIDFLQRYGYKTEVEFTNTPPENRVDYPAWSISLPNSSTAQIALADVLTLQQQYYPKAIVARPGEFEGVWAEFLRELEKTNYRAIEEFLNEQLALRRKNWAD
jgi:putative aldouronate transport system substrate-binding protein